LLASVAGKGFKARLVVGDHHVVDGYEEVAVGQFADWCTRGNSLLYKATDLREEL
jgi:hypothetical protein